ncbi:MAG TPA: hypothetical protein VIK89_07690 [Cytophagaceae bacterium]|jgi:hypothetical protein
MKKYENYDKVEAYTGEVERLEPGGYICKILKVQAEERDYGTLLRIAFDIAEGDYKDFYRKKFESKKQSDPEAKWPGMYYQTVREDSLQYFKGFMTSIEESNPGYKWNWDEKTLVGKLFGGVFGEEEYEASDGSIKTSVKCRFIRSIDAIKKGNFKIPEVKTLQLKPFANQNIESLLNSSDDDLPF